MKFGVDLLLVYLWALQEAGSIPSSRQSGCIPELVKVKKGERLSLHCASYCHRNIETPTVYAWWKIDDGGKKVQLSHTGAILSKNIVSPEAGGEYTCKCGESGHLCTYYIAVLPEVIFSSSQSAAHYGDTLNLSCAVEGYPVTSNTSLITNHYFIKVEEQSNHVFSQYKVQSSATVYDIGEEDYTCSVVIYYKENLVVNEERTLKIKLYNPPSILYTTEYVVHYVSDFGSSGQLSCVVKTSPDTESHVTWWSSGKELQEGKKYKMSSSAITEGVKLFKLGIEDLQQSDIGSYLCQLSSEYNREESQEAWVQVDYRNEASRIGGSLYTENDVFASSHKAKNGSTKFNTLLIPLLCLIMSTVAGLGLWGLVVWRRRQKKYVKRDIPIVNPGQEGLRHMEKILVIENSISLFQRKKC